MEEVGTAEEERRRVFEVHRERLDGPGKTLWV